MAEQLTAQVTWLVNDVLIPVYEVVPIEYFYGVAAYALGVPLFQLIWGDYKIKSKLFKPALLIYNIVLSIFSFACFLVSAEQFLREPMYGNDCDLWFSAKNQLFKTAVLYFAWSKYVEFLDTLFLILNNRGVSLLHYFHHIGAPIDMAALYYVEMESVILFIGLNSFIHTVMYAYYGACIAYKGSKTLKALKPFVTSLQIAQFVFGLYNFTYYLDVPCFVNNKYAVATYYFTFVYVFCVLLLFTHFFIGEYLCKSKKKVQ